jgi:hypothetical protein
MKKTFYLFSVSILLNIIITVVSHAGEKRYLPIEERLRTLSLPPRTWKIDIGIECDIFELEREGIEIGFDDNLMNFQIPHLAIGRRTEFHFLYPLLKF